jgi:hypothetical protein
VNAIFSVAQQGVLESYGVTACNQYPTGSTAFKDTYVYEPQPTNILQHHEVWFSSSWGTNVQSGASCGEYVTVPAFLREAILHY